jgi:Ca-activated chloride channel family protein
MNRNLRVLLALSLPSALLALAGCAKEAAPPSPADGLTQVSGPSETPALGGEVAEVQPPPPPADPLAAATAQGQNEENDDADVASVEVAQPMVAPLADIAQAPEDEARDVQRERRTALDAPRQAPSRPAEPLAKPTPRAEPAPLAEAVVVTAGATSKQLASKEKAEKKASGSGRAAAEAGNLAHTPPAPTGGATLSSSNGPVVPVSPVVPVVIAEQRSTTEEYTDHGVNPYTLVSNDRHSTFSIDVDTAAYSVARRKLNEGALPPEAAVRVEEFINFFDYPSYAAPAEGPFAVHMAAMADPFRPGHHTLRVGVQGKELTQAERQPVHITFLVDVSGSMQSADKLPLAKRSMHMLVDGLGEDDTVALATYAGQVARILPPTKAMNKRQIHEAIDRLGAGGSTAMSAGIDLAYGMAMESFRPGHENRVVILSDGDANVGAASFDTLLAQIKQYADKGVTLSTIGLGMGNYRDTLMEQLANKGDGNNFYIDSQAQAQRVFVEELGGSMLTIARDVKIQVEFNPDAVSAYRLVGYENRNIADKDFRNDRVDAGEVGSGHDVTAVYDVILKDGYAGELAAVRMRWEAPGADKAAQEKAWRMTADALGQLDARAKKDTQIAYAAATFAEVLRGSPTAAEVSMDALIRYTKAAARPGQKDDQELISLMEKARALGAGERGQALSQR